MRIVIGEVDVEGDIYKMRHGVNLTVPEADLELGPDEFAKQYLYPAAAQLIEMHKQMQADVTTH
jgi:hypothetical protein